MKRTMTALVLACFAMGVAHSDQQTLIDFSDLAPRSGESGTPYSPDPTRWVVVFLPSGAKAGPSSSIRAAAPDSAACPSGALEAIVDFSRAPAGTTGVAILPPSGIVASDESIGGFSGTGLLSNVGAIKSVSVLASSSDPGVAISVVLADEKAQETYIHFGSGFGPGCELRVNVNPRYIDEVRSGELKTVALAPGSLPYRRLAGICCSKPKNGNAPVLIRIREIWLDFDMAVYCGEAVKLVREFPVPEYANK
ncbi:MAG: hypothetical protein NT080_09355 [Spirochaetes bacterium]|nr:hypothetical protein [Spirochaetota bacterium]